MNIVVAQIWCFAPSKEAARIEGSKAFSKDFMARHKIPTAAYANFTDVQQAKQYIDDCITKDPFYDMVIKASGLAAGKGVVIPETKDEIFEALDQMMLGDKFGDAGTEVAIEEFLNGEELSIHTFSDGKTFKSMPAAQDHKRVFDGDKGPNTSGMGCYSPVRAATPSVIEEIQRLIIKPTLDGLMEEGMFLSFLCPTSRKLAYDRSGTPFVGMLFTGIMPTESGPKCLEYNARFGDPEAQTLHPLLESDLAEIMLACMAGNLPQVDLVIEDKFCVAVILASGGYPGE